MALEMIAAISQAEKEAEQTVKAAQAEARRILKDATDRSYQIGTQQEEETEREVARIIAEGENGARAECEEIMSLSQREISAMRHLSEAKQKKAVELIVERISE